MTMDTNENYDVTTKTMPIKHLHDLLMDITATIDMNNHMKMANFNEKKRNFKNFDDNNMDNAIDATDAIHTLFDMINMIDETVNTIHDMRKTIELTEEMQKVTDKLSDNACKTATMNKTIVMSYKMIEEMTETFNGMNATTAGGN